MVLSCAQPLLESAAGVPDKPFVVYPDGKEHIGTHPATGTYEGGCGHVNR